MAHQVTTRDSQPVGAQGILTVVTGKLAVDGNVTTPLCFTQVVRPRRRRARKQAARHAPRLTVRLRARADLPADAGQQQLADRERHVQAGLCLSGGEAGAGGAPARAFAASLCGPRCRSCAALHEAALAIEAAGRGFQRRATLAHAGAEQREAGRRLGGYRGAVRQHAAGPRGRAQTGGAT